MSIEKNDGLQPQVEKFVLIRIFDLLFVIALISFSYMAGKLVSGSLEGAYITNIFKFFSAGILVWWTIYFRPRNDPLRRWFFQQWRKIEDWL